MPGGVLILAALGALAGPGDGDLKRLADEHDWFGLRRAIQHGTTPPFFRGLVAAAFNDVAGAEKYLGAAIAGGLDHDKLYAAHQALAEAYFRNGRYQKGVAEGRQTWALRAPSDSERHLMTSMEKLPDITVSSRRPGPTTYSTWDDVEILAPVTINGKAGDFILDTDSNISVISESEAKRLELAGIARGKTRGDRAAGIIGLADHSMESRETARNERSIERAHFGRAARLQRRRSAG
jgi:hypothetical protein